MAVQPLGHREQVVETAHPVSQPGRRRPTFRPPPWLSLPGFLEPHLAARNAATVNELPYRIERPLHFSNGGGLYEAVDDNPDHRFMQATIDRDNTQSAQEALLEFYRRLRPGDPPNPENAKTLLNDPKVRAAYLGGDLGV